MGTKEIVEKDITGPIIVLGAKPHAQLPETSAAVVVTANNAAPLGLVYRKKYGSRLMTMASSRVLRDRTDVQQAFSSSNPDEVILLGHSINNPESYVKDELGLPHTKVRIVSPQERNFMLLSHLGARKFLLMLETLYQRGVKHLIRYVLPDLLRRREMSWLNRSTGINAILYCRTRFPNASEIIVAGIGLQAGEHFNGQGAFKSKDAKADRITMKYWHPQYRKNVYTTDDALHTLGKVPKWKGEYLVESQ